MKQINLLNKIKYLINAGTIKLTGFEPEIVLSSVRTVITEHNQINKSTNQHIANRSIPQDYTITKTSWRVLKLILGNAGLSNKWWGIETRNK